VKALKEELRRRMQEPIPNQGARLRQVVAGFFAYHAVPTNRDALGAFRYHVLVRWMRTLTRRSPAVRRTARFGPGSIGSQISGCRSGASFILGPTSASPSFIQGGGRMRECRTSGSVRGVLSNGHPYRDPLRTPVAAEILQVLAA
jgi:hypothetical protein